MRSGCRYCGRLPPVPRTQERADHVGLHRSGTEERDVDDEVVERLGGELADQLTLTRRLDLEAAEGVRRPDEVVGGGVVERDGVEVGTCVVTVDPADLVERVRHRRLHADAEHVELEQTEVLDVVLVELAHGESPSRSTRPGCGRAASRPTAGRRTGAGRDGGAGRRAARRVAASGRASGRRRSGWRAARAARAARSARRGRGCAGTPWPRRRSLTAAGRARRRRRGSRAGRGRCRPSRRRRPGRRRSARRCGCRSRCAEPTRRRRRCRAAPDAAARESARR